MDFKKTIKVSAIMLLFCGMGCYSGFTQADWYVVWEDEKPIEEFLLKSGEKKDIIISSGEDVWVGFKSDASSDQFNKYYKDYPITLEQQDTGASVSSVMGAASVFKPRKNKIKAVITNAAADDFNILIYTKDK